MSEENAVVVKNKTIGTGTSILHLMYNFGKQFSTVAAVYVLGYYNISPAWLICPLILSVLREQWKKEKLLKRNIAKAAALSNEKDVILARVDDLPAWVFFPDIERAEWLNRILSQVWPNVNHYAKDLIKEVIEPAVQESLNFYKLTGFAFKKMRIGSIPPRIGGVKVYDKNIARNEIIMDMDLFYAGDCDISFTLKGLTGGIQDFQIHGMIRVVMKPLITTMPLVGGLQIYFLNNPTIDFNLVGVVDLLDMPGLSDLLRKIIVEQVAAMMVLPNKLPIVLSESVPVQFLKFPEPQGVLRVHVVEAKHLMKKDISLLGKGKSDPYAILILGDKMCKTQTIDNTVDPKWDYWCEFPIFAVSGQTLDIRLMDEDDSKKDSKLGRANVDVHGVARKGQADSWITLEEAKHGLVHLRLTWLQLSEDAADLKKAISETQHLRVTSLSTSVLMVYIDSFSNLPCGTSKAKPDTQVTVSVAKVSQQSNVQLRNDAPVFEQGFTFLVPNPETDMLHLKIVDTRNNSELGNLDYTVSSLLDLDSLQLQDQPMRLRNSGPDSKVSLSLRLRVLKYMGGIDPSAEEVVESSSAEVKAEAVLSNEDAVSVSSQQPPTKIEAGDAKVEGVVEVVKSSEAPPRVEALPSLIHRRHPSATSVLSSTSETSLGKIQLTLRYSVQRQRLIVIVHKIANLPITDPSNIPDPYVKLYLLPEKSKESKRKTGTVKDNCNPVYDETFEYIMSQGEMISRQLEITVLTQKTWKSPVMGQVLINLAELDLTKAITEWYELQPGNPKEKDT